MISDQFKQALKTVTEKLQNNNIQYTIIGTTSLALQGINVKPNDIDIIISLNNLKKAKDIFSEYNPSIIEKVKSSIEEPAWEIKMQIQGIEVQIIAEKQTGIYLRKLTKNNKTTIKLDNLKLSCFTLEAEAQAYQDIGRSEKAQLIREFLGEKN